MKEWVVNVAFSFFTNGETEEEALEHANDWMSGMPCSGLSSVIEINVEEHRTYDDAHRDGSVN